MSLFGKDKKEDGSKETTGPLEETLVGAAHEEEAVKAKPEKKAKAEKETGSSKGVIDSEGHMIQPDDERRPWVWLKSGKKAFLTKDLIASVDKWDSKTGRALVSEAENPDKISRWRVIYQQYLDVLEHDKQHEV